MRKITLTWMNKMRQLETVHGFEALTRDGLYKAWSELKEYGEDQEKRINEEANGNES